MYFFAPSVRAPWVGTIFKTLACRFPEMFTLNMTVVSVRPLWLQINGTQKSKLFDFFYERYCPPVCWTFGGLASNLLKNFINDAKYQFLMLYGFKMEFIVWVHVHHRTTPFISPNSDLRSLVIDLAILLCKTSKNSPGTNDKSTSTQRFRGNNLCLPIKTFEPSP